jgi:hypothetical protein
MFNFRNSVLALLAVLSMSFAGSANANLLKPDNRAAAFAATPSLMIPIPGLLILDIGRTQGVFTLGIDLFPKSNRSISLINFDRGNLHFYVAVGPVPEPETYMMMALGLGLVAFAARRRNKTDKSGSALTQAAA